MMKENQSYQLDNISVAAQQYGKQQLNSLKQTRWQLIKADIRTLVQLPYTFVFTSDLHNVEITRFQ